jgi:hypothetical protein
MVSSSRNSTETTELNWYLHTKQTDVHEIIVKNVEEEEFHF